MELLTSQLTAFFAERGNEFETDYAVLLSMTQEEDFFAEYWLPSMVEVAGTLHDADLRIETDGDTAHTFIDAFKLTKTSEINPISYNYIWMRYLNGDALFYAKLPGTQTEFGFRLVHAKTIIFNIELHFYDEWHGHLTMPQDFYDYIRRNEALLRSRI